MNARSLVLFGILLFAAVVGFVSFNQSDDTVEPTQRPPAGVRASAQSPTSVRPVGLMINAPTRLGEETGDDWNVDLAFLGTFSKTRLALELDFPAGGIIELSSDESTLSFFQDDKGTDLMTDEPVWFGPFEMMPRISEDGRNMVFVVGSNELPRHDASRLQAKGSVAVMVADETETWTADDVAIQPGTTFTVGSYEFEITETGKSDWSEGWTFTIVTQTDTAPVVRYALVKGGEELELRETMSMSGGGTWHQSLEVDQELSAADFLIEVWSDPRTVQVPFDVSAGLGLR